MSEPICVACQRPQTQLSTLLKRCSRCQQVQYCSTECQKANWPQHKRSCFRANDVSSTQAGPRATFRLHDQLTPMPENETIFFIRKSMPHLDDTTIAGPFYPHHTIVEQIMGNFHQSSQAGMNIMQHICRDDDTFAKVDWIKAPLDSDPSKIMFVEILAFHNPPIAAQLPGPVYTVISTVTMTPQEIAAREASGSRSPYPRVKKMEIHGCYANLSEANDKAEQVGQDIERDLRQHRRTGHGTPRQFGGVNYGIVGMESNGQLKAVAVEVRYDSGRVRYA